MRNILILALIFNIVLSCSNNPNNSGSTALNSEKELIDARLKALVDNDKAFKEEIIALEKQVVDGDIIVRTSDNLESNFLRNFSDKDKTFSHAGVAYKVGDSLFVFNAVGGAVNPNKELQKEPFVDFCYTTDKTRTGCGIFRYNALTPEEQTLLKKQIFTWYEQKLKFDTAFNIYDDEYMYCSEMIAKALKIATNNRVQIEINSKKQNEITLMDTRKIKTPVFEYYAMDAIYVNPWVVEIKRLMKKNN
jgi:hypothetical protein